MPKLEKMAYVATTGDEEDTIVWPHTKKKMDLFARHGGVFFLKRKEAVVPFMATTLTGVATTPATANQD